MYYSGLYKTIRDLEEKRFYDVSILFLSVKGYPDPVIVDGPGDGGRDVTCKWEHMRIQLSVRKDWDAKINAEAKLTEEKGCSHFIYVTNRRITDHDREQFIQSRYKYKGRVDVTIFDLSAISTALSLPGAIDSVNKVLGLQLSGKLDATPMEIAISNTLLFSSEAKDLREDVLENSVRAHIFSTPGIIESKLSHDVAQNLGSLSLGAQVDKVIHRLISKGDIQQNDKELHLNEAVRIKMEVARDDFIRAKKKDIGDLVTTYNLSKGVAEELIDISLEILARNERFDGDEAYATRLSKIISDNHLQRRKQPLFEDLSKLTSAKVSSFGEAISHILSTNTYDILRSLGKSKSVISLLDSSVAMPMLFGLSFSHVKSRYGIGASALSEMCKSHQIEINVPRPYLNEMASHGFKALEYVDIYNIIGDESRSVLRASGNAYLSHFGHIRDDSLHGSELKIEEFLDYFGLSGNASMAKAERRIEQLLNNLGIEVVTTPRWKPELRTAISELKSKEAPVILDHDASVLTMLSESSDSGYIFATWDKHLTELVELKSRIYADTPSRVVDFLSMARSADYESEQTISLMDSLVYCDERKAEALAKRMAVSMTKCNT